MKYLKKLKKFLGDFIMKILESGKVDFLGSEKLPIRGLVICWSINSRNRDLAKAFAKVGMGNWRKIGYGKVLFAYFFNNKKYRSLLKHLEEQG